MRGSITLMRMIPASTLVTTTTVGSMAPTSRSRRLLRQLQHPAVPAAKEAALRQGVRRAAALLDPPTADIHFFIHLPGSGAQLSRQIHRVLHGHAAGYRHGHGGGKPGRGQLAQNAPAPKAALAPGGKPAAKENGKADAFPFFYNTTPSRLPRPFRACWRRGRPAAQPKETPMRRAVYTMR